jgi:hypothetical protein
MIAFAIKLSSNFNSLNSEKEALAEVLSTDCNLS